MKSKELQLAERIDMFLDGTNEVQDAVKKIRNSFMCKLTGKPVPKEQTIYLPVLEQSFIWNRGGA